jgi:signal transduction histidine kinase/AraC-like DNA-binding protein
MVVRHRIAVQVGMHDPYWVQVREAVIRHAIQRNVEVVQLGTLTRNITNLQLLPHEIDEFFEELIVQDVHGLICNTIAEPLLRRIVARGIPIIDASESFLRYPLFTSRRGLYDAAHTVGHWLAERLQPDARVLVVGGYDDMGLSRLMGIKDALATVPTIQLIHIPCEWLYHDGVAATEIWVNSDVTPIDAVFGLSDSLASAGRDVLARHNRLPPHTLITGINGDPLAMAEINHGHMHMTVETVIDSFAAQMIDLVIYGIQNQQLPATYDPPRRVIERHNVAQIAVEKLISFADLTNQLVGVNRLNEQRRLRQIETSIAITQRVGTILDHTQLINEISALIRLNYGYDRVLLWRFDEHGQLHTNSAHAPQLVGTALGAALHDQRPIFIPDTSISTRYMADSHQLDTRTRVIIPIRFNNTITGLLDVQSTTLVPHTHDEIDGLQLVADQIGIALRNIDLYQAAKTAQYAAEQADRLKTRLLANVSHELRTPLHIILGYSQLLVTDPKPHGVTLNDSVRADIVTIQRSAEHLILLINDLLDLSRAEIDELVLFAETINPHQLITQIFGELRTTLHNPQVTWELYIPDELPMLYVDPVRVRQIITNLLSNAAKFTSQGHITIGTEVSPPYMHLWVSDTGTGIEPSHQDRIFEPFVTIDHHQQHPNGVGLGLAITRRLVALHHGILTVESQYGVGSTFHVYLPLRGLDPTTLPLPPSNLPAILVVLGQHTASISTALQHVAQKNQLIVQTAHTPTQLDTLIAHFHPVAIGWDSSDPLADDAQILSYIQTHDVLGRVPFLIYNSTDMLGTTPILQKPLSNDSFMTTLRLLITQQQADEIHFVIVDDHAQMHDLYQSIITRTFANALFTSCYDGNHAREVLQQIPNPRAIILDLVMPEGDGFELLAWIRSNERLQSVPVIIISGKVLTRSEIQRLNYPNTIMRPKIGGTIDDIDQLLHGLSRGDMPNPPHLSSVARIAMAYIQQQSTQRISREQIANVAGVSESYLTQVFQQELGVTPWVYLTRYRIAHACQLLREKTDSITDIAITVGFDDPGYFSKVFRNEIGLSPREYRNNKN